MVDQTVAELDLLIEAEEARLSEHLTLIAMQEMIGSDSAIERQKLADTVATLRSLTERRRALVGRT